MRIAPLQNKRSRPEVEELQLHSLCECDHYSYSPSLCLSAWQLGQAPENFYK